MKPLIFCILPNPANARVNQCSELRTGPQRTSPTDDGLVGPNLLQDPRSLVQTADISELGKVR